MHIELKPRTNHRLLSIYYYFSTKNSYLCTYIKANKHNISKNIHYNNTLFNIIYIIFLRKKACRNMIRDHLSQNGRYVDGFLRA